MTRRGLFGMIAAAFAGNQVAPLMAMKPRSPGMTTAMVTNTSMWYFVTPPVFKVYPVDSEEHGEYKKYMLNIKYDVSITNPRTVVKITGF